MPLTAVQLMQARPEFASAGVQLVAAMIAEATLELDSGTWGRNYDTAVSLLAAHKLWASPFGSSLRLDGGGDLKSSRYTEQLEALRVARVPRMTVLR